jgi:UDP-N-acetylglucosamine--N-acetylmuramyl-(pentapeptide) pyrophosphoryl-undecaprenol N-acetylglucosamine transferase
MNHRWIIAGGGTGGHVTPALALGEALRDAGEPVRFIGTRRGLEQRLVPDAGFELLALDSRPIVGRSIVEQIRAFYALLGATFRARRRLREFGADLVISVGGYASVPAALAALLTGTPVVLVNTDATPGAANRMLARFARRIFVGFEGGRAAFASLTQEDRIRVAGVPLRKDLLSEFRDARSRAPRVEPKGGPAEPRRGEPGASPQGPAHLFIFGGSQGARQINDAMIQALPRLDPARIQVVHQTGEADRDRVEAAYAGAAFEAEVIAFERDMPSRYRWADLVLCRAGAISVAELALAGRASLLVPLAHVGGGEQFANARELEHAGAARVLDSRALTSDALVEALEALLRDPSQLRRMGENASKLARPEAPVRIIEECRSLLAEGSHWRRG